MLFRSQDVIYTYSFIIFIASLLLYLFLIKPSFDAIKEAEDEFEKQQGCDKCDLYEKNRFGNLFGGFVSIFILLIVIWYFIFRKESSISKEYHMIFIVFIVGIIISVFFTFVLRQLSDDSRYYKDCASCNELKGNKSLYILLGSSLFLSQIIPYNSCSTFGCKSMYTTFGLIGIFFAVSGFVGFESHLKDKNCIEIENV